MCHSDDSRPPGPPNPGEVAWHGPLELTAEDGNRLRAYRAEPATPVGRNVVILPDVRGLHPFYEALAQRFAEAGFDAVAIDYFGRTAGTAARADSFEFMEHVRQVRPEHVRADAGAAVAFLTGEHPCPTFTVGFCFGGSHSWRLAASDLPLAGCAGFYGRPSLVEDVLDQMHLPQLLLLAGADQVTPAGEFRRFTARLETAGKDFETHVYDGAPHSFFDRAHEEWREDCADAWRRILDFTARHAA